MASLESENERNGVLRRESFASEAAFACRSCCKASWAKENQLGDDRAKTSECKAGQSGGTETVNGVNQSQDRLSLNSHTLEDVNPPPTHSLLQPTPIIS